MYYLTWIAKIFVVQLAHPSNINGDIHGLNPATPTIIL